MQSDFKQGLWWATNVIIHSLIVFLLCSAMWTKMNWGLTMKNINLYMIEHIHY